jgi:hypothetical protein
MNIFYFSKIPEKSAECLVNRHSIKMATESAQMLSTVHRILDGVQWTDKGKNGRSIKRWKLDDDRELYLYKAGHVNHPSTVWTRQSNENYLWHFNYFVAMLEEYRYRYGRIHACTKLIPYLKNPPKNIPIGSFTEPTPAMDKSYIIQNDSVASYRNYYVNAKRHLADWSGKVNSRPVPEWYINGVIHA